MSYRVGSPLPVGQDRFVRCKNNVESSQGRDLGYSPVSMVYMPCHGFGPNVAITVSKTVSDLVCGSEPF